MPPTHTHQSMGQSFNGVQGEVWGVRCLAKGTSAVNVEGHLLSLIWSNWGVFSC